MTLQLSKLLLKERMKVPAERQTEESQSLWPLTWLPLQRPQGGEPVNKDALVQTPCRTPSLFRSHPAAWGRWRCAPLFCFLKSSPVGEAAAASSLCCFPNSEGLAKTGAAAPGLPQAYGCRGEGVCPCVPPPALLPVLPGPRPRTGSGETG